MEPYKSALIAALPFLLRCAAIEECRNRKEQFFLLRRPYCGAAPVAVCIVALLLRRSIKAKFISDRRNRKRRNKQNVKKKLYCGRLLRRPQLPAEGLPKHGRKHRRSSHFGAAIEAPLYNPPITTVTTVTILQLVWPAISLVK